MDRIVTVSGKRPLVHHQWKGRVVGRSEEPLLCRGYRAAHRVRNGYVPIGWCGCSTVKRDWSTEPTFWTSGLKCSLRAWASKDGAWGSLSTTLRRSCGGEVLSRGTTCVGCRLHRIRDIRGWLDEVNCFPTASIAELLQSQSIDFG